MNAKIIKSKYAEDIERSGKIYASILALINRRADLEKAVRSTDKEYVKLYEALRFARITGNEPEIRKAYNIFKALDEERVRPKEQNELAIKEAYTNLEQTNSPVIRKLYDVLMEKRKKLPTQMEINVKDVVTKFPDNPLTSRETMTKVVLFESNLRLIESLSDEIMTAIREIQNMKNKQPLSEVLKVYQTVWESIENVESGKAETNEMPVRNFEEFISSFPLNTIKTNYGMFQAQKRDIREDKMERMEALNI